MAAWSSDAFFSTAVSPSPSFFATASSAAASLSRSLSIFSIAASPMVVMPSAASAFSLATAFSVSPSFFVREVDSFKLFLAMLRHAPAASTSWSTTVLKESGTSERPRAVVASSCASGGRKKRGSNR
jgi:hypothetical protein